MTATQNTPVGKEADAAVQDGRQTLQRDGDTTDTSAAQNSQCDSTYPEGGLQAWLVVFGAWCAMISAMGLLNTLAVLQAWVSEHQLQGMPESAIGWIFSTYGFFIYFCGAQIGPIFDAYDIRLLIMPGSVGIVASVICMSFSTEFYHFLLSFGVLGGISASLLFYPSISAISHWFYRRRSPATGISFTAGGLGGVAYPLIILYLGPIIRFPWAIRVVGLISAVTSALACCLLRKRLPPNKAKGGSIDLKALSDRKYAVVTLAVLLVEFAVFIPYTYISSYAIFKGMGLQSAYKLNALLNAGAIPGRVLPGYFADRFGVFNVMILTGLACTAFIFALWLPIDSNEAGITAFTVLYGFWSGAAIALTPVCTGRVCQTEDIGKRTGTRFFITSFGVLTGIPIAGAILQTGGYRGLIILAGSAYAASVVVFAWARGLVRLDRDDRWLPWGAR
ncbi:MFS transporter asaE [Parachaetomium inaequale]|uniref:MFS transporter asaE n=1 Tax=Parachaetomium inaequale TaxID=2588326 RepID=A0AAN6P7M7_9PEZI|nr:MFS transporter asaE [Parachaetomium inaequale]